MCDRVAFFRPTEVVMQKRTVKAVNGSNVAELMCYAIIYNRNKIPVFYSMKSWQTNQSESLKSQHHRNAK